MIVPGQPVALDFPDQWSYVRQEGCVSGSNHVASENPIPKRALVTIRDGQPMAQVAALPLPQTGSVVLGTIVKLSTKEAVLHIHTVDGHASHSIDHTSVNPETGLMALIRLENIRKTEKDKLKMGECFRLGDTVKALILSLGDARFYEATTAENHLGVVRGRASDGAVLVPLNWKVMVDPKTGHQESRKVAKPE